MIETGGGSTLISPPSIRGYARLLLAYEDYVASRAGIDQPITFIEFCASADHGLAHLLHVAIERDHPAVTFDMAREWVLGMNGDALLTLVRTTLFRPREQGEASDDPDDKGQDIALIDWGSIYESRSLRRFSYDEISAMTIDQVENAQRGGMPASGEGRPLSYADVLKMFDEDNEEGGRDG